MAHVVLLVRAFHSPFAAIHCLPDAQHDGGLIPVFKATSPETVLSFIREIYVEGGRLQRGARHL
jgi:hypothetical protein